MDHKYLFILSPPYSGSTLITKLIGTSKNASIFSSPQSEGQKLKDLKEIMMVDYRWNKSIKFPWKKIKEIFLQNWDLTKPILVEKSPPNIIKTDDIIQEFQPVFFIITIRNPYTWTQSYSRRSKNDNFSKIARRWIFHAKHQMKNITNLKNSLFFKYEDLTNNPEKISTEIKNYLSELNDINYKEKIEVHSIIGSEPEFIKHYNSIVNLDHLVISKLSLNNIHEINDVLKENKNIMNFFSYDILSDEKYNEMCKKV